MDNKKLINLIYVTTGIIAGFIIYKIIGDVFDYYQNFQKYINFTYIRYVPNILGVATAVSISLAGIYNDKLNVWMSEVVGELKKVTWPTKKDTTAATVVVIITLLIMAVILYAFDFLWGYLIKEIIS